MGGHLNSAVGATLAGARTGCVVQPRKGSCLVADPEPEWCLQGRILQRMERSRADVVPGACSPALETGALICKKQEATRVCGAEHSNETNRGRSGDAASALRGGGCSVKC